MSPIILITGAATGFGALNTRAIALTGYIVFAGIRWVNTTSKPVVEVL